MTGGDVDQREQGSAFRGHRAHYFVSPNLRPMGAGLDLYAIRKDGTEFPTEIADLIERDRRRS